MTAAVVETDIDRFIRDQKSKLAHERRALATNSRSHAGTEHTGLPIGESQNEARRKQLQAERNREYNEMVQKKAVPNRRPPPTPDNMAPRPIPTTDRPDPRGRGAVRQSQNDAPPQLHDRRADLPPKPATPGGFLNRLGRDNGRKEQLGDERRREYNQFMAEKSTRGGAGRRDQGEYSNGIAGLRDANSAKRAQAQDVPPDNPRRGWATPTYEEMLQQKRQEEARYRRFDDPEYKRPGMKSYGSEGALNGIDAPRRGKDLDLDLDRRLRLDEGRRSILEDPLWLSPRRAEIYDKEFNSGPPQYPDPPRHAPAPARHTRDPDYYATLPVGRTVLA